MLMIGGFSSTEFLRIRIIDRAVARGNGMDSFLAVIYRDAGGAGYLESDAYRFFRIPLGLREYLMCGTELKYANEVIAVGQPRVGQGMVRVNGNHLLKLSRALCILPGTKRLFQ